MSELARQLIAENKKNKSTILDLGKCGLTEVPAEIGDCYWLETLILSNGWWKYDFERARETEKKSQNQGEPNQLQSLPTALSKLSRLKELVFNASEVSDLSPLSTLDKLQELNCSGTQVSDLSPLAGLANLQILNYYSTQVSDLSPLSSLGNLQILNCSNTQVSDLSPLAGLANLQILNCSDTQVSDLSSLAGLANLQILNCSDTQVSDLSQLSGLINLQVLYCFSTQVSDLSPLSGLVNLQLFSCRSTQVSDLLPLSGLVNLQILYCSSTPVSDLSPILPFIKKGIKITLKDLLSLNEFGFNGCPLTNPPIEIVAQGNEAILDYFAQKKRQGEDYIFEAKALILGKPRAGKTSLTLKIQDENAPLPKFEETTKGIDVYKWDFDLTPADVAHVLVGKTPEQQAQIVRKAVQEGFRVNLWDFGGQEIYTATHQFFLSNRSLYMIVDAENNETTNWYDWFYQVEKLGNKSPLLVILNKLAGRDCRISDWTTLKGIFDFIKEKYSIDLSLASDDDKRTYHTLKADIKRHLLHLPHIGDPLPAFWTEIRQIIAMELDELKAKKAQPFITEARFFEICRPFQQKDPQFNRAAQLRMSQYFHDIGIYLHFKDDDHLRNLLFLDANWTTDLVYMLLDDPIVRDQKHGRFNQTDIDRIWGDDYYAIKGQLMHLLRHFGLAFPIKQQENEFLTPYHLSDDKPSYVLSIHGMPLLELQYKFKQFMPKGMLPQLTVSLSDYIPDVDKIWRKGVVLQFTKHRTICELTETYQNEIHIKIYGQERRETLTILMYEVDKILKRFSQLDYAEMIPCNCLVCTQQALANPKFDRTFFPFQDLKERLNSPNSEAHFVDCKHNGYKKMPIQPLLAEVFDKKKLDEYSSQPEKRENGHVPNTPLPEPTTPPTKTNQNHSTFMSSRNLIILGVSLLAFVGILIYTNRQGKFSIGMEGVSGEVGPKENTQESVQPAATAKKVKIKGFLKLNNTSVATSAEVNSVRINLNGVNPEYLDPEGSFTFTVPSDKLEKEARLEVIFADGTSLPTPSRYMDAPDGDNYIYLPTFSINKKPNVAAGNNKGRPMKEQFVIQIINNNGDNNNSNQENK